MLRCTVWALVLCYFFSLGEHSSFALMLMDPGVDVDQDASAESVPELFPLNQLAVTPIEPLRTEANTELAQEKWLELKSKVLADSGNRISVDFRIPEGLEERTRFWFDIYARYGSAHHVIHHALYPWIIYKVVDATETLQHGKGPQWLRMDQANKMAKAEVLRVRLTLQKLARRTSYANLSPAEREMYDKLVPIKGPRRQVFIEALHNVRSQLGQKDFFAGGLVNSSRYLPYMEEQFRSLGLPTELTRLPFVESSFNVDARSRVGASGIWQIMPSTGQAYMIVNRQIDERNSPLKATLIAGRLLHSYNHALNSWPLTITSYNHGIGNIQKAIRNARSHDLAEIIRRYHKGDFKFASANFFTCFLAALYAEKYHEIIFTETPREPLQEREILRLAGPTNVRYLLKRTGLTSKEMLRYNLDIKSVLDTKGSLPRGFSLYLPPGYSARLTKNRVAATD